MDDPGARVQGHIQRQTSERQLSTEGIRPFKGSTAAHGALKLVASACCSRVFSNGQHRVYQCRDIDLPIAPFYSENPGPLEKHTCSIGFQVTKRLLIPTIPKRKPSSGLLDKEPTFDWQRVLLNYGRVNNPTPTSDLALCIMHFLNKTQPKYAQLE